MSDYLRIQILYFIFCFFVIIEIPKLAYSKIILLFQYNYRILSLKWLYLIQTIDTDSYPT